MEKKTLIIKIEGRKILLELKDSKESLIDSLEWEDENNMSTELLGTIDTLVKRNKIGVGDLGDIKVLSDQKSYTSTRIASAVAKTVSYCLT